MSTVNSRFVAIATLSGIVLAACAKGGTPTADSGATRQTSTPVVSAAGSDTLVAVGDSVSGDSLGFATGSVKVRADSGSGLIAYTTLQSGNWVALGDIVVTLPPPPAYPGLPTGQTYVLVRRSAGVWQSGLLNGTTFTIGTMIVSAGNLTTARTDAKIWKVGPTGAERLYLCYTCDRKACCPQSASSTMGQNQADVNGIAAAW